MRYTHTNLVARDQARLARFYEEVFGCERVPPERDQSGAWLERGTGVPGAALRGVHLRLPGHGPRGPTLEVYTWAATLDGPAPAPNRVGLGHLAFEVDDVPRALAGVLAAGGARQGEVVTRDVPGVGRLTFTYARDPEGNLIELQRWDAPDAPALAAGEPHEVRAAYDRWATEYDHQSNATRDADAAVLRRLLPPLAGRDVLELGCGTGKNTAALTAARSVTALDFSEAMLARAAGKVTATNVRFARHDLTEPLPYAPASFDLVTADLVLEHLPALAPLVAEVARVLRPGGEVIAIELHPYRQMAGAQARFEDAAGATVRVPATHHGVSEYVTAACAAGLRVTALGEWDDAGDAARPGATPRLVSLQARRE